MVRELLTRAWRNPSGSLLPGAVKELRIMAHATILQTLVVSLLLALTEAMAA